MHCQLAKQAPARALTSGYCRSTGTVVQVFCSRVRFLLQSWRQGYSRYLTAIVTPVGLPTDPIWIEIGTVSAGKTLSGTRKFTWIMPDIKPGAAPAYSGSTAIPLIAIETGNSGFPRAVASPN